MKEKACLDTGIITQLYAKDVPPAISNLMNSIKGEKLIAYVLLPILIEVYYHICKLKGKMVAETTIASFLYEYPVILVNLDKSLIFKSGLLKCQHRKELAYNDCISIAYSLNKKLVFHTTEKDLSKIVPNLKLKIYIF